MKKFEKRHMENWARTRKIGRKKYAIRRTIVITVFIILGKILDYFTFNLMGTKFLMTSIIVTGLVWLLFGSLINYFWIWNLEEERYQKLLKKQS